MIAAVNGICAGGGLHFVADADIVIASSNAEFLDPHVSVGQVTAFETIGMLKKSPMESIARMAYLGRHERVTALRPSARSPFRGGRARKLRARAQNIAETIARHPLDQLRQLKRQLWAALEVA